MASQSSGSRVSSERASVCRFMTFLVSQSSDENIILFDAGDSGISTAVTAIFSFTAGFTASGVTGRPV